MSDPFRTAEDYLRLLGHPTAEGYRIRKGSSDRNESSSSLIVEFGASLAQDNIQILKDRIDRELSRRNPFETDELVEQARAIVMGAESGVNKLRLDGPEAVLSKSERISLEAIVEANGTDLAFVLETMVC